MCTPAVQVGSQGTGSVRAVAVFPAGDAVVTGSEDGTARIWDAATGPLGI